MLYSYNLCAGSASTMATVDAAVREALEGFQSDLKGWQALRRDLQDLKKVVEKQTETLQALMKM